MDADQMRTASDSLEGVLSEIDAGGLEATPGERAFLAGAAHAMRTALE